MSDLEKKKNVSTKGVKFPNPLIKSVIHTFESYETIGDDTTSQVYFLGKDMTIYTLRFHDGATPISLKTRDPNPINKSWVSPFFLKRKKIIFSWKKILIFNINEIQ